jgi:hypothetical protein
MLNKYEKYRAPDLISLGLAAAKLDPTTLSLVVEPDSIS